MPMMRRGPLDRYPPEWVLRQANAHQVSGGIEFHTERPVTFYLEGGRIYGAEEGVDLAEQDLADRAVPDEHEARDRTVRLLATILQSSGGWYFHDPLGRHPGRGSWAWETATLLMETRAKAHEGDALAAWARRPVSLHRTSAASITLSADAWAVVVDLAATVEATELRARLGWNPERLRDALGEIDERGVIAGNPAGSTIPSALASASASPSSPVTGTGTDAPVDAGPPSASGHHTGPLAPPPAIEHRTLRQRVRPSRRNGS